MKPRILDLFCKEGGAGKGYAVAGFEVVGVDIEPQPNYPFEFIHDDVMNWLAEDIQGYYDAIHASPPCQAYSGTQRLMGNDHPALIAPTRELLEATGLPYVIENVKGAPLRDPQMLEGQMFGLNTHRPRLFETNWGYEAPHLRPPPPRQARMGRKPKPGEAIQLVGNFSDVEAGRRAIECPWMSRDGLREAVPPAYTEAIGAALLAHLETEQKAAA